MSPEPPPSDWDPCVLSTINAPLPEPIDGDRLASLIAADSEAVLSCILDSFFLEVPPEAALRFLAARGISIETAKAAFQAACASSLPTESRAPKRWDVFDFAFVLDQDARAISDPISSSRKVICWRCASSACEHWDLFRLKPAPPSIPYPRDCPTWNRRWRR